MATSNDIKNGLCIKFNYDIYKVVEFQHVKPGKGAAFVRTKMKSLSTGRILENTFPAGHKIEPVRIENRKYQFLYNDGQEYHFMNNEDFDELTLQKEMINAPQFLRDGDMVVVVYNAENHTPMSCELPANVVLTVTFTEPGEKGNTATNTLKPATVETGAEVRVPLFINEGDKIRVDTESGAYLERVKE
jgi:elongation factor P